MTLKFGLQSIAKSFMASCFTGMPVDKYESFFFDLAERFVKDIDTDIAEWSEGLVPVNSRIHILTGSFLPLAEGISNHLGWGHSLGTEVEIKSEKLTGNLAAPALKGREKIEAIKNKFNLEDSHFRYLASAGDSFGDRFLLEKCSLRYFPKKASKRLIKYFSNNV